MSRSKKAGPGFLVLEELRLLQPAVFRGADEDVPGMLLRLAETLQDELNARQGGTGPKRFH
jgi:hypothetical protein